MASRGVFTPAAAGRGTRGRPVDMSEIEDFPEDIRLIDRSELTSKVVRGVAEYWDRHRLEGVLPPKTAIDPFALKPWLPYLSISEAYGDPFRMRYRLVGTEVVRVTQSDFTGRWLHESGWPADIIDINTALYRRVWERRLPLFGLSTVLWDGRVDFRFEWGVLPFSTDGTTVTHFLGVDDYSTMSRPKRSKLR